MQLLDSMKQKVSTEESDVVNEDNVFSSPPESWLLAGAALLGGIAANRALIAAWQKTRGEKPPINPAARDVSWRDAILWAAAVGAAVGVARVVTRRGATSALLRWRG